MDQCPHCGKRHQRGKPLDSCTRDARNAYVHACYQHNLDPRTLAMDAKVNPVVASARRGWFDMICYREALGVYPHNV